ncbi:hypothetical protein [Paraglaciecola sp. L3A3]|uniref:hypothetical protein n=1 Tax=Paraglaciecola sp. L3A3 TaxID=2686358 RepID=UPI00131D23C2|nr:hypothetical protein [Paraglaciecola sp. L3A3]
MKWITTLILGGLFLTACSSTERSSTNLDSTRVNNKSLSDIENKYTFIGSVKPSNDYFYGVKYENDGFSLAESGDFVEAIYLNPENKTIGVWFKNLKGSYASDESFSCRKGAANTEDDTLYYMCESEFTQVEASKTVLMNGLLAVTGIGLLSAATGTAGYFARFDESEVFETIEHLGIDALAKGDLGIKVFTAKKQKTQRILRNKINNSVESLATKVEMLNEKNRQQQYLPTNFSISSKDQTSIFSGDYATVAKQSATITVHPLTFSFSIPNPNDLYESVFKLSQFLQAENETQLADLEQKFELQHTSYFAEYDKYINEKSSDLSREFYVACSSVEVERFTFDVSCKKGNLINGIIHIQANITTQSFNLGRVYPKFSKGNDVVAISVSGGTVKLQNMTNTFIKINTISSYVNKDIYSAKQKSKISLSPASFIEVPVDNFLSKKQRTQLVFNSLNAHDIKNNTLDFGWAIEYQLSSSSTAQTLYALDTIRVRDLL